MSAFLNFAGNQGTTFKNHGTGGGTSFTLDLAATTNSVLLAVGGVLQEPGVDYTVSGTTITTTTSVTAGIEVFSWIIHKPGTAPTIQDNSVTGGKIALTSQAEGDLMYCNASGDWVRLAKGTAGQVLKQNSGLTAPEWGTVSSDFVLLETNTFSGASTSDFTNFDNSTYESYLFTFSNITAGTDGNGFAFRMSTDGGSSYISSNYAYAVQQSNTAGNANTNQSETASFMLMTDAANWGNAANEALSGNMYLYGAGDSAYIHSTWSIGYDDDQAGAYYTKAQGAGRITTSGPVDAVRFLPASSTISGTIKMYGLK